MKYMFVYLLSIVFLLIPRHIAADSFELYFPKATNRWETISPERAGIDPEKLQKVIGYAKMQNSTGLIMLYEGRILVEKNWKIELNEREWYKNLLIETTSDGRTIEDVASVQKSIISFIAGVAREKGKLDIDRSVSSYIGKGWSQASLLQEKKITIRHLLSMSSGLTNALGFEAPSGTIWKYNTKAYSKMIPVLEAATGMDISILTADWLTSPVGMYESRWIQRSWYNDFRNANKIGFATSARDLAKFGLLILANGKWNGYAIIKTPKFLFEALEPSQNLNPNYGYLWWLNNNNMNPYMPRDAIFALGHFNRVVLVIPSKRFVAVRIGNKTEDDFLKNILKLTSAAFLD